MDVERGKRVLERLAVRVQARQEGENRCADAADEFDRLVREAGAFSWIGVVTGQDEFRRASLAVYLVQRMAGNPRPVGEEKIADVVHAFDNFAISVKPNVKASLYMVKDTECTADRLEKELRRMKAWHLKWSEELG